MTESAQWADSVKREYPLADESQRHFYSECIFIQRFWAQFRDWAHPYHDANYKIRYMILGKPMEYTYSFDNTLLREARSTIWKARLTTKQNIERAENKAN